MSRTIFLLLVIALSWPILAIDKGSLSQSVEPDSVTPSANTLLDVARAGKIDIYATDSYTSITVSRLDDTDDNFFYETETKRKSGINSTVKITCNDITNVLVNETDKEVNVSYLDSDSCSRRYDFVFADPENRSQKSYIGTKWSDFAINLSGNKSTRWEIVSMGPSVGWVTPTKPLPDFNASMGRSVELSWMMIAGVSVSHRSFSVAAGLGIDWRNFVTKGDRYFFKNPDGRISLEPYSDEMTERRSRIKIFSLQVPVVCTLRFGHNNKWGVTAGPLVNFNTSASIKTQYKMEGQSFQIKTGSIGQRPVTVDAYFAVHYDDIGLYARYSPMNMMKSKTGMDFGAFSTGIALLF